MKIDKNIKNIILAGDALNTLNGGFAAFTANWEKKPDQYILKIKAPGVTENRLKVEIHNNCLFVFYLVDTPKNGIFLPYLIKSQVLGFDIDFSRISACLENDQLMVSLPFNEMAQGFHREIEIRS